MLSSEEILEMLQAMLEAAEKEEDTPFWDGWDGALWTLRQHILTDVKASCFPVGSCACHPFRIPVAKDVHSPSQADVPTAPEPVIRTPVRVTGSHRKPKPPHHPFWKRLHGALARAPQAPPPDAPGTP